MTNWKTHEINRVYLTIGKYATIYNQKAFNDDRRIVVNIYRTILKGLEELPDYIEPWLRVAIKKQLKEELETCYKIIEKFENVKILD